MKKIFIIILVILFFLTGFIDTTPDLTEEEVDEKYGITTINLSYDKFRGVFHSSKIHHYSLLNHQKVEYVIRGTKKYSHLFGIRVRVADKESYIMDDLKGTVRKTLSLEYNGYQVKIQLYNSTNLIGAHADAAISLDNGFLKVIIVSSENANIEGYWEDRISEEGYIKIFEDILSAILPDKNS